MFKMFFIKYPRRIVYPVTISNQLNVSDYDTNKEEKDEDEGIPDTYVQMIFKNIDISTSFSG